MIKFTTKRCITSLCASVRVCFKSFKQLFAHDSIFSNLSISYINLTKVDFFLKKSILILNGNASPRITFFDEVNQKRFFLFLDVTIASPKVKNRAFSKHPWGTLSSLEK